MVTTAVHNSAAECDAKTNHAMLSSHKTRMANDVRGADEQMEMIHPNATKRHRRTR